MSINAVYQPISIDYEKSCQPKQILLGCNMDTSSKGGVSKVFFVKSNAQITKVVPMTGQVKISGYVNIKVVYLNTEKRCESFDYITDFVEDIECDGLTEDMQVRVNAKVVDSEYQIGGDQIKIQVVVELRPIFVESKTQQYVVSAEGALVKDSESCNQSFVDFVDREIEIAEEYDSGMNVEKILFFDVTAGVDDVSCTGDIVSVKGRANVEIIYLAEGKVIEKSMDLPFEEEWRKKTSDLVVKAQASIKNSKLVLQGTQDSAVMRVEALCKLGGVVMSENCLETVEDMFCPEAEVDCQYSVCDYNRQTQPLHCHINASGSEAIDDSAADVKQVLAAHAVNCTVADVSGREEMTISGMAEVAVIYLDENDEVDCKRVEVPFVEKCQYGLGDDKLMDCTPYVKDVTVKVKRDREFEINLDIDVTMDIAQRTIVKGISEVVEGEARQVDRVAISIYTPKQGESLWDVAKQLAVSDKEILAQNPDIGDVMTGEERLVVYRELKV